MKYKYFVVFTIAMAAFYIAFVCSRMNLFNKQSYGQLELARVGERIVTDEDFLTAVYGLPAGLRVFLTTEQSREKLLKTIIDEEIFLQEAQRLSLDKDKNFMRLIELYWRRKLIDALIAHTHSEVGSPVTVSDEEVRAFYERMKSKYEIRVLELDTNAKAKAMKQQYEQGQSVFQDPPSDTQKDSGWKILDYERINAHFREQVAVMGLGDAKLVEHPNKDAVFLIVLKTKYPRKLPPLEKNIALLKETIAREKYRPIIEQKMSDLRSGAEIEYFDAKLMDMDLSDAIDAGDIES